MKIKKIKVLIYGSIMILFLLSGCVNSSSSSKTIIYNRLDKIPQDAQKVTPESDVAPPVLLSSDWQKPLPLPGNVNSAGIEDSPFILPDGNELYFFFSPDAKAPPQKQLTDEVSGIYYSKKMNGNWSEPERIFLQDNGKLSLDGCHFINGNTMWFCSAREGNFRDIDIYIAELKNGIWRNWKNAGKLLNIEYEIGELHMTADGEELYFHSERNGGKGGLDIWVSENIGGNWQEPKNLEEINSVENEGWPFISQDKCELWFTRTYRGTPAIFRSKRPDENSTWSTPELIIYQFAGEPSLDKYGNIYFVHHYYFNNVMLESDIYIAVDKNNQKL